ncbi:alpha/beta hydrolase [Nonomuraea fuscirosea]|uniref:alpha/beta hydrolase n=1 Tax=Nonomuraea fuscirosea TaxID=1291556 RepID=UPI0037988FCE
MITTADVHNEGAQIVYDHQGSGPLLLLISGGGGDAARHRRLAALLAEEYTVVSYDRRCNFRSSGDLTRNMDMAQQARDAVAVIHAMGHERAYVFGNSCGASIGLELAAHHPWAITKLIAHEAPVMSILPDGRFWQTFMDGAHDTYVKEGNVAAMKVFHSSFVGFEESTVARISAENITPNSQFFLSREFLPITYYVPDLDRIRANGVAMVSAAGSASAGAFYARTAPIIAERTGCPFVEFPGNHIAFINDPEPFAQALRDALR